MSETNPESNPEPIASAWEVAVRLGGAIKGEPLPGIMESMAVLAFDVVCLNQLCDECESGSHPPLSKGLYSVIHTLGWLFHIAKDGTHLGGPNDGMFVDNSDVRRDAIAAMPAFARLLEQAVATDMDRKLISLHAQLRDLLSCMTLWLNDPDGVKESLDQT